MSKTKNIIKIFLLLVIASNFSCTHEAQKRKLIIGRYMAKHTDFIMVVDLYESGLLKNYHKQLDGEFEKTGNWKLKGDSIELNYYLIKSFDGEEETDKKRMVSVNWLNESLENFEKISNISPKNELINEFVKKLKDNLTELEKKEQNEVDVQWYFNRETNKYEKEESI